MTIYTITKLNSKNSKILKESYNLEEFSIFKRMTIKSVMREMIQEISSKAKSDDKFHEINEGLNDKKIKIFTQLKNSERVFIVADSGYITEVGFNLISKCFQEDTFDKFIKEYAKSEDHDLLKKIEKELEKCNIVVAEGLSHILERGENLSELVDKSENLSVQTRILFKTAKKKNSCC